MKQMKVNEQVRCMSRFEVCLYGQQKIDIKHFVAYTCTCILVTFVIYSHMKQS
jgi:hypothetical protein